MSNKIEPTVWVHTRSFAYFGRRIHPRDPKSIWLEVERPPGQTNRKSHPAERFPARIQTIALPWERVVFAEALDEHGRRITIHQSR